jgi:hypothetical protein
MGGRCVVSIRDFWGIRKRIGIISEAQKNDLGRGRMGYGVRTSQIKATRSCQGACLGRRVLAAVVAMTAMPAMLAKE